MRTWRGVGRAVLAAAVVFAAAVPASGQAATPNDPMFDRQFGLVQMHAPEAWTASKGAGVTIAVVDSGVDTAHPDLKDKLVDGYDFADSDANPDDDSTARDGSGQSVKGHGTHVAGIAAAITDNGLGVAGTAPDAKVMPLKAFTSNSGSLLGFTAVPDAIRFAVNNGAKVINLSLGTFSTGVSIVGFIEAPCADALQRGVLCVVAAGNSGDQPSGYAKDFPGLIVAAGTKAGRRAQFSQRADTQFAVMAPGEAIHATIPVEDGGYGVKSGTSMAAPHAAGLAALLYAKLQPPATAAGAREVIDAILSSAVEVRDEGAGRGRADAAAALGVPIATTQPVAQESGAAPTTAPRQAPSGPVGGTVSGGSSAPQATPTGATAAPAAGDAGLAPLPAATTDEAQDAAAAALLQPKPKPAPAPPKSSALATLGAVAGLLVVATGWWSGSLFARDRKSRKLKPFVP